MTEINGVFNTVSPDPEEGYREAIDQLREEGMIPDELVFHTSSYIFQASPS